MWAAIDAKHCIDRNWCTPIGGHSVWSTFTYNLANESPQPLILVTAKLDSLALIHELSFGAAERTGAIVLLSIAEALSKVNIKLETIS